MSINVVIPAAGHGTRMRPLSKGISKCMIPVNGKPIIFYILNELLKNENLNKIVIIVGSLTDTVDWVNNNYPSEINKRIFFKKQELMTGPLDAIKLGVDELINETGNLMVWLGDTLCFDKFDFSYDFLAVQRVEQKHRWCMIDNDLVLYDKPVEDVPTDTALVGIYNFKDIQVVKNIFNNIYSNNEIDYINNETQISSLLNAYKKINRFELYLAKEWYDCGDLQTYYKTKASLMERSAARSFNKLKIDNFLGTVKKTSDIASKKLKIEQEKNWFLQLSDIQKLFVPKVLRSEWGELVMSYESGSPLNEIFVYENMREDAWEYIIDKIVKIHDEVFYTPAEFDKDFITNELHEVYVNRISERLSNVNRGFKDLGGNEIIMDFFNSTTKKLFENSPKWSKIFHGDSHLGNILFDTFNGVIKFVDPRGGFATNFTTYGDIRYDMAKMFQDLYCGYSHILEERIDSNFEIEFSKENISTQRYFEKVLKERGYDTELLKDLSILLLLTAIPFHTDNQKRQLNMYNRALKLIKSKK